MNTTISDYSLDFLLFEPLPLLEFALSSYLEPITQSYASVHSLQELHARLVVAENYTLVMELYSFHDTLFEVVQCVLSLQRHYPRLKLVIFTGIKNVGVLKLLAVSGQLTLISKSDPLDELQAGIRGAAVGYRSPVIEYLLQDSNEDKIPTLSAVEWQVLRLFVAGQSAPGLAEESVGSNRAFSAQKKNIMRKIANRNVEFNRLVAQLRAKLTLDNVRESPEAPLLCGYREGWLSQLEVLEYSEGDSPGY